MWTSLKDRVRELNWNVVINESELKIVRSNKSTIEIISAEKPGRLRGRGIDFIALDEYAEYRTDEIWREVVRPALSDKRGAAFFALTPKGFNHAYELAQKAKSEDDWAYFQFKTIDSPFFKTPEGQKEIEQAKALLSKRDFSQEYCATFENFQGRIYYAFDRLHCNTDLNYTPQLPLIVGMDFNRSPMTASLMQKHGSTLVQFGEIFLQSSDTPEICRTILQQFPKSKGKITIRPDATGKRTQSTNMHVSDHNILMQHGFELECGASNPFRVDRWASVNNAFEKGWVKINVDQCPYTIKDLEVISYKEGTCEPMLTDKMLGHISDALGYAVHYEFPILGDISIQGYA
jgi:hypothetical protein